MRIIAFAIRVAACLSFIASAHAAADGTRARLAAIVDAAIRPLMAENDIPGVAVGVIVRGRRDVFNYGVAARDSGHKVDDDTLFELGSISKTFTATLAAEAQVRGRLSLADPASKYWPALAGSRFDAISLRELATYTAGGLPLQFPDAVNDTAGMLAYFRAWTPAYPPGSERQYSNPSIGLFGYLAAKSLGAPFAALIEERLLPALHLRHTFLHVPARAMPHYALGYTKTNAPIRVAPGMFDAEAYGLKTTAADMLRFVAANMDGATRDTALGRAILATHTGYVRAGALTQALGWESVDDPTLDRLLAANAPDMIEPHPATALTPPAPPRAGALINKTGSTNGFSAYVAFVPAKHLGIVIFANKNAPIPARVRAAYAILSAVEGR